VARIPACRILFRVLWARRWGLRVGSESTQSHLTIPITRQVPIIQDVAPDLFKKKICWFPCFCCLKNLNFFSFSHFFNTLSKLKNILCKFVHVMIPVVHDELKKNNPTSSLVTFKTWFRTCKCWRWILFASVWAQIKLSWSLFLIWRSYKIIFC
jgi:hypothetical protein